MSKAQHKYGTMQAKRTLVLTWEKSGKTRSDFAKAHGVSRKLFSGWVKRYSNEESKPDQNSVKLYPVELSEGQASTKNAALTIRLPNGIELHPVEGCDTRWLGSVVGELKGCH